MRFVMTLLLWLITTVALAVAIPTAWVERHIVDEAGYSSFAATAAKDPGLQRAVAGVLTAEVAELAAEDGASVDSELIRGVASAYTASPAFPGQFARANQIVHRWMFTDTVRSEVDPQGRWVIDLSPMLSDTSFRQTLDELEVEVPSSLPVPLTENAPDWLRPGQLQLAAVWGPWVSVGATILTGVFALLTLAAARSRGKALAALGVSGLLVGAAGWAGLEVVRGRINDALAYTTAEIRDVADAVVNVAEGSLHQWLNLTLAAGGVLVVFGVIVAMLGSLRRRG